MSAAPELGRVVVIDAQSSGASPAHGHLLELAWSVLEPSQAALPPVARLVALPPGAEIPPRIQRLTGITPELAATGTPALEVARELLALAQDALVVAHYARFERSFLAPLAAALDVPLPPMLCTYELARRLCPALPRHSLRAVAGWFGHKLGPMRRAGEQVAASVLLWRSLSAQAAASGVVSHEALRALVATPAEKPSGARSARLPRERRLALPDEPGVYRFLGADGSVLYVGKASSLRHRVNSYFQKRRGAASHIRELVAQVWELDVSPQPSAVHAALLEHDEIKRLDPPYNVSLRQGERRVVHCDACFAPVPADTPGAFGPLSESLRAAAAACHRLARLASEHAAASSVAHAARGSEAAGPRLPGYLDGLLEVLSPPTVTQLFASFSELAGAWGLRELLRLGLRLRREERCKPRDEEASTATEEEAPETVLDPSLAAEGSLRAFVASCARQLALQRQRACFFAWLSRSRLAWSEGELALELTIERGQVVRDGDARLHGRSTEREGSANAPWGARTEEVASDPLRQAAFAARRCALDVATMDRLRVLCTELRRLRAEGQPLQLWLGERALGQRTLDCWLERV